MAPRETAWERLGRREAGVKVRCEKPDFTGLPTPAPPPHAFLSPDKQSLRSEPSVVIVSCKDGRQLLSIPRAGKRHAGLYECSATNVLGSITSSCTVSVARELGGWAGPLPQR